MPDTLLQLDGVDAGYRRQAVLRHVSMSVAVGDFWFLLGPNGTGKSTLIKVMLGVLAPMRGRLHLHPSLADRRAIGFVPQRASYRDTMPTTVREFTAMGLVKIGLPRGQRREHVEQALAQVDLLDRAGRDFWTLSGGQQQRAVLARALVRRPRLLIVDEPTNGLDPVAEENLLHLLAGLNRQSGLTLLFVSHDLATAARYASHAALFHHGQVNSGPVEQVLTPDNLQACYGLPIRLDRRANAVTVSIEREASWRDAGHEEAIP